MPSALCDFNGQPARRSAVKGEVWQPAEPGQPNGASIKLPTFAARRRAHHHGQPARSRHAALAGAGRCTGLAAGGARGGGLPGGGGGGAGAAGQGAARLLQAASGLGLAVVAQCGDHLLLRRTGVKGRSVCRGEGKAVSHVRSAVITSSCGRSKSI